MRLDLNAKSQQLLETLANSIHDRDPKNPNPFFFSINEIHVAHRWLEEFVRDLEANSDR